MAKSTPFAFVLDELLSLEPHTRPMFGCTAVYVGPKIVLILRDKLETPRDSGVWLATTEEHHGSLQAEFPSMRSIEIFGPGVSGWQVLPVEAEDFEASVVHACELIRRGDPRIGKIPGVKKPRAKKKSPAKRPSKKR